MDLTSNRKLLKHTALLIAENKELKEKYRLLSESYDQLSDELEQYRQKHASKEADADSSGQTRYRTATVLFAEFKGFSDIMAETSANIAEQMDKLDMYLFLFTQISEKYHLVKVQSIGDSFICVGGVSEKNNANPITVTLAALEMLYMLENDAQQAWSVNIGIHTGAVTARIERKKQTAYRVKGDTVNTVSRMVAVGQKNTVNISATTYEMIKELFECTYVNLLPVKYRNKLELYTVRGIHAGFASDSKRYLPNDAFRTRLLLFRFGDLQEYVLDMLENGLPAYLYYHNVKHTVDVVTESELIGWAEGLNDQQLLLLKTAALFHDTGHLVSYADHEERSTEIARKTLPAYDYTPDEINEICRIIMATKLPPKPADILEAIICDADLDYLGRTDFIPVSNALYEELKAQNKMPSINEWNKMQLKFISAHQYFTKTGRELREVKKQEQIERIRQLISEDRA
ncbi:MAG: HD domain-containing protein [Bacteroidales bacterium]|nr:HD domain-containing protein [Bacteroidales bacterium]